MKWDGQPVSISYLRQATHQFNVRKINKVDICPICTGATKKPHTFEEITYHKVLANTQIALAMDDIRSLPAGDLLVIQDFTQLPLSPSRYIQDFILVMYQIDPLTEELVRAYHHYVGDEHQSNDIQFVQGLLDRFADAAAPVWLQKPEDMV